MRVIEAHNLKIDNYVLTGTHKVYQATVDVTNADPLKASNVLLCGAICKEGSGKAVIIRIGENTALAQIKSILHKHNLKLSSFTRDLNSFGQLLIFIIFCLIIILLIICLALNVFTLLNCAQVIVYLIIAL